MLVKVKSEITSRFIYKPQYLLVDRLGVWAIYQTRIVLMNLSSGAMVQPDYPCQVMSPPTVSFLTEIMWSGLATIVGWGPADYCVTPRPLGTQGLEITLTVTIITVRWRSSG
jgi:hypothetical protein